MRFTAFLFVFITFNSFASDVYSGFYHRSSDKDALSIECSLEVNFFSNKKLLVIEETDNQNNRMHCQKSKASLYKCKLNNETAEVKGSLADDLNNEVGLRFLDENSFYLEDKKYDLVSKEKKSPSTFHSSYVQKPKAGKYPEDRSYLSGLTDPSKCVLGNNASGGSIVKSCKDVKREDLIRYVCPSETAIEEAFNSCVKYYGDSALCEQTEVINYTRTGGNKYYEVKCFSTAYVKAVL